MRSWMKNTWSSSNNTRIKRQICNSFKMERAWKAQSPARADLLGRKGAQGSLDLHLISPSSRCCKTLLNRSRSGISRSRLTTPMLWWLNRITFHLSRLRMVARISGSNRASTAIGKAWLGNHSLIMWLVVRQASSSSKRESLRRSTSTTLKLHVWLCHRRRALSLNLSISLPISRKLWLKDTMTLRFKLMSSQSFWKRMRSLGLFTNALGWDSANLF